jgi:hypothetical protein
MNLQEIAKTYSGIECVIVWADSPDGEEDVFISFGKEEFDTKSDLETFYYFDEEEVQGLLKAVTTHRERYSVNNEWWIELMCDYALVVK